MIRRFILTWKLDRALAKRRRNRRAYSEAAKRGAANAVHNAFARDVLVGTKNHHGPIKMLSLGSPVSTSGVSA